MLLGCHEARKEASHWTSYASGKRTRIETNRTYASTLLQCTYPASTPRRGIRTRNVVQPPSLSDHITPSRQNQHRTLHIPVHSQQKQNRKEPASCFLHSYSPTTSVFGKVGEVHPPHFVQDKNKTERRANSVRCTTLATRCPRLAVSHRRNLRLALWPCEHCGANGLADIHLRHGRGKRGLRADR